LTLAAALRTLAETLGGHAEALRGVAATIHKEDPVLKPLIVALPAVLVSSMACSQSLDYVEGNRQVMLDAARSLMWPEPPLGAEPNRAYLLVKTQTIRAPIAIIFGYADNAAACEELARDLSTAANARGFLSMQDLYVCDAVY
jgi:hypothetical protein